MNDTGRMVRARRARARRDRGGIALLMAVSIIMILTTLVTDLAFGSQIRMLQAAHERDEIQATYLARSGVGMYRLILTANKQLSKNAMYKQYMTAMGIPPGDGLWRMIPFINTGLLRMLLVSDGDPEQEDLEEFAQSGQVSEEIEEESREEGGRFSGRNFLDFHGDFTAEVKGEDCRVSVNALSTVSTGQAIQDSAVGKVIAGLMSGDENEQWLRERNLDKWDLINNLRDWVDADNVVASGKGGYEDDFYNRLDSPYLSKNARFDTPGEIRMVEGWQDEVFDKFGGQLSIFGTGKVNINCAEDAMLEGLLRQYITPMPGDTEIERIMSELKTYTAEASFSNGSAFVNYLKGLGYNVDTALGSQIVTKTSYFRITSLGQVGDSTSKITAVLDYSTSDEGKVLFWRED